MHVCVRICVKNVMQGYDLEFDINIRTRCTLKLVNFYSDNHIVTYIKGCTSKYWMDLLIEIELS